MRRFLIHTCVGWALALTAVATSPGAEKSALRAITHEDVWLMKRVGRPSVSPDGKWAVFSVIDPAYEAKDQVSDLWLVPTDGSAPPRRITHSKGAESGPDWSPDGRRLAFSAKREESDVPQIYVLNLAEGGEAEAVTALSTGARSPRWSPDGSKLLFVSEVYPGAGDDEANQKAAKEEKGRKWNARVYEGFPVRYWDHWLDVKKAALFVQEARFGASPRNLLAGTRLVADPGFGGRESDSSEDLPAAWAPDGGSVVFVATAERNRAAYSAVSYHLYAVGVQGGEPRLLAGGPDSYGQPQFLPDGRAMLVSVNKGGDGRTYHHDRIARFPWPMDVSQRRVLTEALDLAVNDFVISDDSQTLYFTAEAGPQVKLYTMPAAGGSIQAIAVQPGGVLGGLSIGGASLVANRESATGPAELGRIDLSAGRWTPLTRFNESRLATLDLRPVESFTFVSAKGRTIESLLVKPAGFDPSRKYPLFVVMHGGPSPQFKDAWSLRWNYSLLASPGYVLLLTNYSGSSGYSEAFAQAIQGDPLKTPGDEINQAADEAIRRYAFIDPTRQVAGGASYGGHLANWMQATTTRYRALISHAGLVNLESQWGTSDGIFHREVGNGGPIWEQGPIWREQNPVRFAANHDRRTGWVTPMLLTVGERDFRVPFNNTLENWSYLQRLQIPSKLIVFPEENHWVLKGENSRFWYGEVHAWLARWLQ